jgi:signal transduction histidine kinase
MKVDANLPPISGDERVLRQVLINLVTNAIKFSDAGSTVTMKAVRHHNGGIRLTVHDRGVGISPTEIRKVLEPFGQADNPDISNGGGTGLGLPLAKAMAELHGGELRLDSTKNVGTKVHIDLPRERVVVRSVTGKKRQSENTVKERA